MTARKAFAHYFTPYPISLDNAAQPDYYTKGYLDPNGEGGKHAAYGGLLRDRPLPRPPLTGDWESADLAVEVAQAKSAGFDGFTVDLLTVDSTTGPIPAAGSRNARLVKKLLAVADAAGFTVALMPDMSALTAVTPAALAGMLATYAAHPSAWRLDDGRLVLTPFFAEKWTPAQWATLITLLGGPTKVALVPCFLNYAGFIGSWIANPTVKAALHGASHWGNRSPATNGVTANVARITDAHTRGLTWMQPVSVQDERPNQGIFDEARNTENLRLTAQAAIDGGADYVQFITWNDYSEGTHIAPSANHGTAYLDLCAYYIAQFKSGVAPVITTDRVYLTHRKHFVADKPSTPQTKLMSLRAGSSPAVDRLEALVFLTAPATVTVTSGATSQVFSAPVGISTWTLPLSTGVQSAKVTRDVATVTSSTAVTVTGQSATHAPTVQDFQYVAARS